MHHYTTELISKAAETLATEWGPLPERVQKAHDFLVICKDLSGFEEDFKVVRECLRTVRAGDYSGVTDEEFRTVASVVRNMDIRSARHLTIKEDVRVLASATYEIGAQGYKENN
jgi:hypothetical protein